MRTGKSRGSPGGGTKAPTATDPRGLASFSSWAVVSGPVAKHRAGVPAGLSAKPPSLWSVVLLAVAGAVVCAVVIAALGIGRPPATSAGVTSVAAEPLPVVVDSPSASPSASPSPLASSPSPSPSPSKSRTAKASATPRVSKTPTLAAARLAARYSVSGENNGGFIAGIEVTNAGPQAAMWTVDVTYPRRCAARPGVECVGSEGRQHVPLSGELWSGPRSRPKGAVRLYRFWPNGVQSGGALHHQRSYLWVTV
jgi:hypothetical protein